MSETSPVDDIIRVIHETKAKELADRKKDED